MKLYFPSGVRSTPVDRNPIMRVLNTSQNNTAPHTTTQRATYTVPAGRRAWIMSAEAWIERVTAAAPVGDCGVWMSNNIGVYAYMGCIARTINNTVGLLAAVQMSNGPYANAGDVITIQSQDNSTGGTTTFAMSINILEFDA